MSTHRHSWLSLLGAALFLTLPASAAEPDEPLPKSAKLRLGSTRMRDLTGWASAALTPDGKHLLTFGSTGITRFDITTGAAAGNPVMAQTGVAFGRPEFSADGTRAVST